MEVFRYIQNPLVAYFDNITDAEYFCSLMRNHRPCHLGERSAHLVKDQHASTNISFNKSYLEHSKPLQSDIKYSQNVNLSTAAGCKINVFNRNLTWAFKLLPRIKDIIEKPDYPKHIPTTVIPQYQSIQHLKYELVEDVAKRNPFKTQYFAWVDIGLFRDLLLHSNRIISPFHIGLPPGFDRSKIAYNEVVPMRNVSNKDIFYRNLYWVCGCFFIARRAVLLQWVKEYKKFTERFLDEGLANTDQRIIYAIQANEKTMVKIQAYKPRLHVNRWFDLAYRCKEDV